MATLELQAVSKSYAAIKALQAVTFQLDTGFYALLGPNGAGKSTLFQLLTGLYAPDQGEIKVNGIQIKQHLPQALAQMGIVFQQSALDLDLTVQANLNFYGKLQGMTKAELKIASAAALEQLGLADTASKVCRTLSGGNRRKVELARALMIQPRLLLMDEATVGLDPASRNSLISHVHDLCKKQDLCVLWATHLIDEAEQAKQVLVLHKGKLLAKDTPDQLMAQTPTNSLLDAFFALSGEARGVEAKVVGL